jgi:hypothetical protein
VFQRERVVFTVRLDMPGVPGGGPELYRLEDNGNRQLIAVLNDNGRDGDATGGDGRYSREVFLEEKAERTLRFQLACCFAGMPASNVAYIEVSSGLGSANTANDLWGNNGGTSVTLHWADEPSGTRRLLLYRAPTATGPWTLAVDTPREANRPGGIVDTVDGTATDLYYKLVAAAANGEILRTYDVLRLPRAVAPPPAAPLPMGRQR